VTYYVGQLVSVATVVTDATGTPTDATVVATVTDPAGVVTTPAVTHGTTGNYSVAVPVTLAGDYAYTFAASGTVTAVDSGQFHVEVTGLRIVGLAEVKKHANITTTTDDGEINDFIATAQEVIEFIVGPVVGTTYIELFPGRVGRIVLLHAPVRSVVSIQERFGSTVLRTLATTEYYLDINTGVIDRTQTTGLPFYFGGDNVLVTYVGGRVVTPNIRQAAKELAVHLYRRSQVLRGGRRPSSTDNDPSTVIMGYAIPNAVIEMLGPNKRAPVVI